MSVAMLRCFLSVNLSLAFTIREAHIYIFHEIHPIYNSIFIPTEVPSITNSSVREQHLGGLVERGKDQ